VRRRGGERWWLGRMKINTNSQKKGMTGEFFISMTFFDVLADH
jgi:hypothetical protein